MICRILPRSVAICCEVCRENEVVSSIQVFFRKNGEVSYSRARHFEADKKFYYHQQSLEYTNRKLREIASIDHCQDLDNKYIGQTEIESSSKLRSVVGLPGFEPESIEPKSTSLDQASRQPHVLLER